MYGNESRNVLYIWSLEKIVNNDVWSWDLKHKINIYDLTSGILLNKADAPDGCHWIGPVAFDPHSNVIYMGSSLVILRCNLDEDYSLKEVSRVDGNVMFLPGCHCRAFPYFRWLLSFTDAGDACDRSFFNTKTAPPSTVTNAAGTIAPNRAYEAWHTQDQRLLSLLLSSLTEESMAEVIGCSTSRTVWLALEAAYNHCSKSRELRLKDDLQLMKKGDCPIFEYIRKFKSICDQLAAIGRPVDDTDKAHWFLRGLGSDISSFSAAQMALTPLPTFRNFLSKAESFALFQESFASSGASNVAFYSQHKPSGHFSTPSRGRGNGSRGRGRGRHSNPHHAAKFSVWMVVMQLLVRSAILNRLIPLPPPT
ncbi:Unknown protein [Striga hermonthica]|uniref:Uncharacterized protein n=1 Tax=Striga hermonthica TaxID=68872 RepID=A0A9N7RDB7_STRHE|nr:Unknown protein [Striga hermonthica]